jgi:hypothetical protein
MPQTLFNYQQQTQRLLREAKQDLVNPNDLIDYINRARREVAMRTQCVRVLTRVSGACTSLSVVSSGSLYTTPTISITPPDFPSGAGATPNGVQATASIFATSGTISSASIVYGGDGYFQPQAIITGGSGASIAVLTEKLNVLNQGQEVYPFSGVNLAPFPGVVSVFAVQGISVIYANYRYSLPVYSFSTYQAYIRQYPFQYQYVPTMASQYGQGVNGSFYVYPLPSQTYQYELDCFCLPQDLTTNLSVEAIPDPWTDAVPYFAAHLGMLELQNYNAAKMYLDLFDRQTLIYSQSARVGRGVNIYGRV